MNYLLLPTLLIIASVFSVPCMAMDGQHGSSNDQNQLHMIRVQAKQKYDQAKALSAAAAIANSSANLPVASSTGSVGQSAASSPSLGMLPENAQKKDVTDKEKEAFFSAAYTGNLAYVTQALSAAPALIKAQDTFGETALIWATIGNHENVVRYLVAQCEIDLNASRKDGMTALMWAAEEGQESIARLLIAHPDIDFDARNKNKKTALDVARGQARREIIRMLELAIQQRKAEPEFFLALEKGNSERALSMLSTMPGLLNARKKCERREDQSALMMAVFHRQVPVVRYMLGQPGIDVNAGQLPALMGAVLGCHEEIVRLLVAKSGIELNAQDDCGNSALMFALMERNVPIIRHLAVQPGINFNLQDRRGRTALMYAAMWGYEDAVDLPGINPLLQDNEGQTALMVAAQNGQDAFVGRLLARSGTELNARTKKGKTALMLAAEKGREAVVRRLVSQQGVCLNVQDDQGMTALMRAVDERHDAVVRLLIAQPGIDLNLQDTKGRTALILATRDISAERVRILVAQQGIDINAQDAQGRTALRRAAGHWHEEVVRILIAHPGIDLELKDKTQKTALDAAYLYPKVCQLIDWLVLGRYKTVELLKQAMQERAQTSKQVV